MTLDEGTFRAEKKEYVETVLVNLKFHTKPESLDIETEISLMPKCPHNATKQQKLEIADKVKDFLNENVERILVWIP